VFVVGDKLDPRSVLVTGGASGIGYAVADALLARGAHVAIGDVAEPSLAEVAARLQCSRLLPLRLDVTSRESVTQAVAACVATFGGLDGLINCAGVISFTSLEDISDEEWDRVLAVDLKGVFLCCQVAAPHLRRSGRGRIVTIASDAGKMGYPLLSSYCAAKFGVIGFSRAIAGELAASGVTVNCVCPIGVSSTGMGRQVLDWLVDRTGSPLEQIQAARARTVPLRRMAMAADVVNAVLFFLSDESSFLTGEALNVDGGVLSTTPIPGVDGG
jgi:NAD(P)-dependent dehydrogenase (short-subunit alcohol dehydrogenase family)